MDFENVLLLVTPIMFFVAMYQNRKGEYEQAKITLLMVIILALGNIFTWEGKLLSQMHTIEPALSSIKSELSSINFRMIK